MEISDIAEPSTKYEALILASGGLDSTACIAHCRDRGYKVELLFVDYGQQAIDEERHAVESIANFYGLQLRQVSITGLGPIRVGFIPGRNSLLLNVALAVAAPSTRFLVLGIHAGTTYVDCTSMFVESAQLQFDLYASGELRIYCPFLNWTKSEIGAYCSDHQVPIHLTYSCEKGGTSGCGECLSCLDREALLEHR